MLLNVTYEFQVNSLCSFSECRRQTAPHSIVCTSDMAPASSKEFVDIQANYRVCIHSH